MIIRESKEFKIGRWVARLFIPVLLPVRFLIVKPIRKLYAKIVYKRYPARLRKAKKTAIRRNTETGKKQFGVKVGMYIMVWSRYELMEYGRSFSKKLGKPFDYRRFAVFTCENGRIIESLR